MSLITDLEKALAIDGRWTHKRKARLMAAIDTAEVTMECALARFGISPEELARWYELAAGPDGRYALRATRAQLYRANR